MMLFKLSLRNIKKSFHDYLIYFATLILGVAIFYVFNSLGSQVVMLEVSSSTEELVFTMMDVMAVVSVFVSFVLGFLVVYASSFLMKRRKREFGIYMLLGMNKRKIAFILVLEMVMIGLISLVIGILLGVAVSQGMSIVVANLFEADMTSFHFIVSYEAILKTILYFAIIYIVVIMFDTFAVSRARLINLVNSVKLQQKNYAKNPLLCIIVFVFSCILLGTAYYRVTNDLLNFNDKVLTTQIVKGILGTFMFFWSLSGLLMMIIKSLRKFYYKGLNSFGAKEIQSRINTTVFSCSIICLLLFFTICILSSAFAIKKSMDDKLEHLMPVDIQFSIWNFQEDDVSFEEHLQRAGVDMDLLKDGITTKLYSDESITYGNLFDAIGVREEYKELSVEFIRDQCITMMSLSDYNELAEAFGLEKYELGENEYAVIADVGTMEGLYNDAISAGLTFDINGTVYKSKFSECKDGFVRISNMEENMGVLILPDSLDIPAAFKMDGFNISGIYSANYNATGEDNIKKIEEYFDSDNMYDRIYEYGNALNQRTRSYLYDTSVGLTAMIIFIGIYLGIVFLISGAAILSLKELSEAADNKNKYDILRRIGVSEKQISKSLAAQCGIYFGLPLLLAVVHSVFGMKLAKFILYYSFGDTGLMMSVLLSGGAILLIYGIYYIITYISCRRIISE